jgi:hypothetical protein
MIVISIVFFGLGVVIHTPCMWVFGLVQLVIGLLVYVTKDESGDWAGAGPPDEYRMWRAT